MGPGRWDECGFWVASSFYQEQGEIILYSIVWKEQFQTILREMKGCQVPVLEVKGIARNIPLAFPFPAILLGATRISCAPSIPPLSWASTPILPFLPFSISPTFIFIKSTTWESFVFTLFPPSTSSLSSPSPPLSSSLSIPSPSSLFTISFASPTTTLHLISTLISTSL